jgi:hypothetical protein
LELIHEQREAQRKKKEDAKLKSLAEKSKGRKLPYGLNNISLQAPPPLNRTIDEINENFESVEMKNRNQTNQSQVSLTGFTNKTH